MKCLVVIAHPLNQSLCQYLAQQTIAHLQSKGYEVTVKDLYREGFQPALTEPERHSYYLQPFDTSKVEQDILQLQQAESVVLIFPTWWFGFPAILKGWFDRVWAPGYAYEHASNYGPIEPRLDNLKEMKVVTTLGSPWWVDIFVLRRPVRQVLKLALLGACTKGCQFQMLSLYNSERLSPNKVSRFVEKIKKQF